MTVPPTPHTQLTRHPERGSTDRAELDALLDESLVGHLAVVRSDGSPLVLPIAIARDQDQVLVHGSTGSTWLRQAAAGAPVCLEVTAVDALVVARSAFESSIQYRSAVLFGVCTVLEEPQRSQALDVLTDHVLPGRVAEVRRPTAKELAATLVLALPISQWSLKTSHNWPGDDAQDVAGDAWAGVVPLHPQRHGTPEPAPDLRAGIEVPASVRGLSQPGSASR
jgi:nitroimidazol reductase NimA-like FMN-containing flavoprotein (pyridoxamine 5'-phosphate oxidase superfamily)